MSTSARAQCSRDEDRRASRTAQPFGISPRVRAVGQHRGECEMRGERVSGLAVQTAARFMAAGGAGEILVSDALQEAVNELGGQLGERGPHELQGVPGTWPLSLAEEG